MSKNNKKVPAATRIFIFIASDATEDRCCAHRDENRVAFPYGAYGATYTKLRKHRMKSRAEQSRVESEILDTSLYNHNLDPFSKGVDVHTIWMRIYKKKKNGKINDEEKWCDALNGVGCLCASA